LTGVHTQYKALLTTEIKATVGVHIGLRAVNITLLGKYAQTKSTQICIFELKTKVINSCFKVIFLTKCYY